VKTDALIACSVSSLCWPTYLTICVMGIENQGLWLEVCIAYQDYGDLRQAVLRLIASCVSKTQDIHMASFNSSSPLMDPSSKRQSIFPPSSPFVNDPTRLPHSDPIHGSRTQIRTSPLTHSQVSCLTLEMHPPTTSLSTLMGSHFALH
jgi:hypothetical protein